ncbi:cytosolic sulfotransferase 8-like isoform X1 [Telopea speciosissima]|uniref:cytosolic sulfotransferase 8-like isoform X1 n=1 Tax=Telopea speciosissima TaxID=54955 RepID=UPI001CC6F565|nr:cytosolic sulfotransferase 8-like isoform X1 [Telopea speciosissima]
MADYTSCRNLLVSKTREEEEENEITFQRYKEIVSNLPKEESTAFEKFICNYQGFWYADVHCQGVLAVQEHFKAHSTDIIIASNPKSGTTWIKALIFATVTRGKFPMDNHPLLFETPHILAPFLEITLYNNRIPDLEILPSPRFFGTHISYTSLPQSMIDSGCPIVYICRNPKDVFVSMWHFKNKMRDRASKPPIDAMEAFERFCQGVSHFGPFWDSVLGYWKASLERPQHVLFLKYEELQADPVVHLKRIAQFVGCPFTSEEEKEEGLVDEILRLCSFEKLSNLEVNKTGKVAGSSLGHEAFFRKGQVGDWKNYLTSEMIERLDQITEEKFHGYGLKL